ncbi:MAG TPA: hypothetical protein VM715_06550, partial [Candidatus Acidoferrum sp.]|nr:hypothetical protein [Candidatus Acidoferrum sp.]
VSSDGVHLNGANANGEISHIYGTTGDDTVAILARDNATLELANTTAGGLGDVENIVVEHIYVNSNKNGVKVLSGRMDDGTTQLTVRNITIRNVNSTVSAYGVWLGGDPNYTALSGGVIDGVSVDTLKVTSGTNAAVQIHKSTTLRNVRVRNIRGSGQLVQLADAATVEDLVVESLNVQGTNRYVVAIAAGTTPGPAVCTKLTLKNIFYNASSNAAGLVSTANGSTLTALTIHDCHVARAAWAVGDFATPTNVYVRGLTSVSQNGWIHTATGGVVTVKEAALSTTSANESVTAVAGTTISSDDFGFRVKLGGIAKTVNGRAFNTDNTLTCGVGPVLCDGTTWKHLYTGATWT